MPLTRRLRTRTGAVPERGMRLRLVVKEVGELNAKFAETVASWLSRKSRRCVIQSGSERLGACDSE